MHKFYSEILGKNDQKIKKVLKNDKIQKDDKYSEIIKRVSYRRVNALDLVEDAADLVLLVLLPLSGVGIMVLAEGNSFTFTAIKFK